MLPVFAYMLEAIFLTAGAGRDRALRPGGDRPPAGRTGAIPACARVAGKSTDSLLRSRGIRDEAPKYTGGSGCSSFLAYSAQPSA